MSKRINLICVLLFSAFVLRGQAPDPPGQIELNWNLLAPDNNMLVGNDMEFEGKKRGVEGTPLLFDTWLKGYLIMKRNSRMNDIKINLKNQEGELYVSMNYKGLDTYYNVDETKVLYFIAEDSITGKERRFEYLRSSDMKGLVKGARFYEVLHDELPKLIKFSQKEFIEAGEDKAYSIKAQKSRYILDETYFFKSYGSEQFEKIKLKKKELLKVLGKDAEKAKGLMKTNKWNWSKEEDIVRLLSALN